MKAVFELRSSEYLIFKGGTSLSKGWDLINRFSEDIDIAIDKSFWGINADTKSQIARHCLKIEISCRSLCEPFENLRYMSFISSSYAGEEFQKDKIYTSCSVIRG